jgi:pilus assembly protein CpaE
VSRVVIGVADQALAQQVQASLLELGGVEVAAIAASSDELVAAVTREDVDVALVHEDLGPEPALSLLRDLSVRRPATAMLLVATDAGADLVTQAMESGARGLVQLPLSFGQLEGRMAAATAWATQMRRLLASGPSGTTDDESGGRGRVVCFAGSKGGVGTTTVATHIALDVARTVPGLEVCLVDLDLEAGDVSGVVEVRHRLGISDLAKVADDLSPGTVADAMSRHESGVDLLLAPLDIRDVEAVTPRALRQVVAALRRQYDLVLVDAGAHVTPAQATALEVADEIVLLVTPDVGALRGMRRTINAWESLGVCKEGDVRVLVNRTSKQVTVSMETVRQLTRATVLPVGLPSVFRRLEPALNARNPLELRNAQWWTDLRQVGREVGLVPQTRETRRKVAAQVAATAPAGPASPVPSRGGRRRRTDDRGSLALEQMGLLPVFGALAAIVWHVAMVGGAYVVQSNAAAAAAREYAITSSIAQAQDAAEQTVPGPFHDDVRVSARGGEVTVTVDVPGVVDGVPGIPTEVSSTRRVVSEP